MFPLMLQTENKKLEFYNQLNSVLHTIPHHDLKLVIGDFNAQIGCALKNWTLNVTAEVRKNPTVVLISQGLTSTLWKFVDLMR